MEKPLKVMWNGKPLRNIYPHATRFQVFKYKVKRFIRKLFMVAGMVVVMVLVFNLGAILNPKLHYQTVEAIKEVDNLTVKVEELKNNLVDDIRKCESAGHKESDGIIVFDTNNEFSIGNFQFQRKTVQHYYRVLYGEKISLKEATLIALDEPKARQLAYDIIYKDSKGWANWFNCGNKVNAKGRLAIIKELSN